MPASLLTSKPLSLMERRDLRRDAVFLCITPFWTDRSRRLMANSTAFSATAVSPDSIDRTAVARMVLLMVRALRFRAPRLTCWRAAFFAGNSFLQIR